MGRLRSREVEENTASIRRVLIMSKGDKRRPAQITQEEMAKRWEMAFKPKQENQEMSEASYQAMRTESQEWPVKPDDQTRPCTCNANDKPPIPCAMQYSFRDCIRASMLHNHTPDCYAHGCQYEHLLTEYEWEEAKMFGQYEQKDGEEVIFFRHVDLSAYVSMMIYQRNKEKETGE